ncbi:MAG: hypothetical protein ABFE07_23545 [Armatimonadia bacterium]
MNLLKETLESMAPHTPSEVLWVGGDSFWFTWDEFARVADVEYDSGFGSQKVASDLVVVGDGWWLERTEYDGSEGWALKGQPKRPEEREAPRAVTVGQHPGSSCGWETLREMNPAPTGT